MTANPINKWSVLASVLIGTVMGPIDASVVYIALPAMSKFFKVAPATMSWVSMAYLLVMASFLLSFGRLGDLMGFKKLFLAGLLFFVATSALCGFAPSLGVLVLLRALQAVGAGMAMSMSSAIITAVFPPEERGRALGLYAMIIALGLAAGPSLGGFLVSTVGWRAIFFVNVPIGIIAFFWCLAVLPAIPGQGRRPFDWQGALLAFVGLGTLLLFVNWLSAKGWVWSTILVGLIALVSLYTFIRLEHKLPEPMLDLTLFHSRVFSAANVAALFNFLTQYVIVFVTPFLLQRALDFPAARAGEIMTAFPLTVLIIAPLSGALSDKLGQRWLAFAGSAVCTLAAAVLAVLSSGATAWKVGLCLSAFGLGTGIFQSPNNSAVMGSVPRFRLGIAGSVLATTRNVGMVLGIVTAGAILNAAPLPHGTPAQGALGTPYLSGLTGAYLAAAIASVIATVVTLLAHEASSKQGQI
ncbi:multidrug resistance protein Stp [Peptococcaceae bacterium CEB3]|nr:multidrug resistance protein Stp [Peptococcaceae bacterium CEB3]